MLSSKLKRLPLLLAKQDVFVSLLKAFTSMPGYSECKRAQNMATQHELKRKAGLRARLVLVFFRNLIFNLNITTWRLVDYLRVLFAGERTETC